MIQPGAALRGWLVAPNAAGTREIRVEYGAGERSALVTAATDAKVAVAFDASPPDRSQLITFVIVLLVAAGVGFVYYAQYMRQSPGSGGGDFAVGSGKSFCTRTTFADVAGHSAAFADLRDVVDFLRDSKRFVGMGAKVPKGILLEGPPGTGKTLMARALAGEAGTNFFAMPRPDFMGMFFGMGTMRVKALLRKGRFDRSVTVALPRVGERAEILSLHASKGQMPLATDVEMGAWRASCRVQAVPIWKDCSMSHRSAAQGDDPTARRRDGSRLRPTRRRGASARAPLPRGADSQGPRRARR